MRPSLLVLATVAAAAFVCAAAAADDPPPLKFAWPVPSKATVTEKILRGGHVARMRYTASLERSGSGPDLRLHIDDFECLDFDGKPSSDPAVAQQLQLVLPVTKALPDLLIAADGSVKDVIGLDKTIATMVEEIGKHADERQKAAMVAQFNSPEGQQRMRRDTAKHWVAWVADWVGRSIPEGSGLETPHKVVCPDGTEIDAPTQYKRVRVESDAADLARYTRESVLDGDDAKAPFDAWMEKSNLPPERRMPATGMRLVNRVVVLTDPATLRPTWVRREEQVVLHLKDGTDRTATERHDYDFEWPAAAAKPDAGGK